MNEKMAAIMKQKIFIASDIRLETFEIIVGTKKFNMKSEYNVCYL